MDYELFRGETLRRRNLDHAMAELLRAIRFTKKNTSGTITTGRKRPKRPNRSDQNAFVAWESASNRFRKPISSKPNQSRHSRSIEEGHQPCVPRPMR
jgi:hypothetical protein